MKIVAIIQARLGSTRLPKKVLLDLMGKTVLERVIERVKACKLVDEVIVATTVNREDSEIEKMCIKAGVNVFRGSEADVLDRYYQAAKSAGADHVVRITSDCPLIDPEVIGSVIELHIKNGADYSSNVLKETFPDGEDVEVIKFGALEKAWNEARLTSEREHVTPYIRNNPEKFTFENLSWKEDLSSKRWTLDNEEDYRFIKEVYSALYAHDRLFGMEEIIDFIKNNPHHEEINKNISRNEGYAKSLRGDKVIENG